MLFLFLLCERTLLCYLGSYPQGQMAKASCLISNVFQYYSLCIILFSFPFSPYTPQIVPLVDTYFIYIYNHACICVYIYEMIIFITIKSNTEWMWYICIFQEIKNGIFKISGSCAIFHWSKNCCLIKRHSRNWAVAVEFLMNCLVDKSLYKRQTHT